MRNKNLAVCACFLVAIMAGVRPAAAVTITDNFNNNSISTTLWQKKTGGGANIKEQNERLEVNAGGSVGNIGYAYLESKGWGIDWRYDFTLIVNYKLALPVPSGQRSAMLGFGLSFKSGFKSTYSGVTVTMERDSQGLWLIWQLWNNGVVTYYDRIKVTGTTGQLKIKWDRSDDRITITSQGKTLVFDGLWAMYGAANANKPIIISMGGIVEKSHPAFSGSKAYMDNFSFTGKKVSR